MGIIDNIMEEFDSFEYNRTGAMDNAIAHQARYDFIRHNLEKIYQFGVKTALLRVKINIPFGQVEAGDIKHLLGKIAREEGVEEL